MDPDGHIIPVVEGDQGEGMKDPLDVDEAKRLQELAAMNSNFNDSRKVGKQKRPELSPLQRAVQAIILLDRVTFYLYKADPKIIAETSQALGEKPNIEQLLGICGKRIRKTGKKVRNLKRKEKCYGKDNTSR